MPKLAIVNLQTNVIVNMTVPWQPPEGCTAVHVEDGADVAIGDLYINGEFQKSQARIDEEAKTQSDLQKQAQEDSKKTEELKAAALNLRANKASMEEALNKIGAGELSDDQFAKKVLFENAISVLTEKIDIIEADPLWKP